MTANPVAAAEALRGVYNGERSWAHVSPCRGVDLHSMMVLAPSVEAAVARVVSRGMPLVHVRPLAADAVIHMAFDPDEVDWRGLRRRLGRHQIGVHRWACAAGAAMFDPYAIGSAAQRARLGQACLQPGAPLFRDDDAENGASVVALEHLLDELAAPGRGA